MKIEWEKCQCGSAYCDYWHPKGFGQFYQGTGFRSEEKANIDGFVMRYDEMSKALERVLGMCLSKDGTDIGAIFEVVSEATNKANTR